MADDTRWALRRMTGRKVVLGADGVAADRGICEATDEKSALAPLMIAQAGEIFLLAAADEVLTPFLDLGVTVLGRPAPVRNGGDLAPSSPA